MKVYIKINVHFFFAKFMLEMEIVQKLSLCAYMVLVRTYSTQVFKQKQYMYPRSLLKASNASYASTACISVFIAFPDFTQPMLYTPHQYEMCFPIYVP